MKRRNNDGTKIARRPPVKRNKISENFYGSSLVYVKLLVLWLLVLGSDYFLEFRFEYLWPFWLFLRSVYDSFKYQGVAFSVLFIFIALSSDFMCYLLIPVHWLFFAASTYVWVQYVWHTEKGICLPAVFLWLLFLYIEAALRLKEFKAHIGEKLPFHLDLCRPFAAHCIGYPVVTLGFGFKSYLGYRMRQRRQKEVMKENEYYYEFCREALPPGPAREDAFNPAPALPPNPPDDRISTENNSSSTVINNGLTSAAAANVATSSSSWNNDCSSKKVSENGVSESNGLSFIKSSAKVLNGECNPPVTSLNNSHDHENGILDQEGNHGGQQQQKKQKNSSNIISIPTRKNRDTSKMSNEDIKIRLEADLKRYKCDLQISRNKENELRDQIISYMSSERTLKSEISNLQVEKNVLESRVSSLLSTRAGEKATLSNLERRLADERKQKADFQIKLETERKSKKDADKAEKAAQQNQTRSEVAKLESELKSVRQELYSSQERCSKVEQELYVLRKYKETHGDPEILVNAVKTMQEKNSALEKSLSAETKLKMDLFSALGDAKRELSIKTLSVKQRDKEISELKAKIAEVLAVMPTTSASVMPSFATSNALSLDLPHSTELSFSTSGSSKSALGLSNLDDKLSAVLEANPGNSGLFTPASLSGSAYTPKTNGTVNDSQ